MAIASARSGIEFPSVNHLAPALVGLSVGVCLAFLVQIIDLLRFERSEYKSLAEQASGQASISQRRLEQFLESSSDWFWEMGENLKFSWVSESAQEHFLDYRALLIGKGRAIGEALYGPNDLDLHRKCLEARLPFRDFVYRPTFANENRWLQTSGVPLFDEEGNFKGNRGTASDVTELVENRKVIATERNLLASVVENLEFPFALWDPNDRLIFANQSLRKTLGSIGSQIVPGLLFSQFVELTNSIGFFSMGSYSAENFPESSRPESDFPIDGEYLTSAPSDRLFLTSLQTLKNKCKIILARDVTDERINAERLELATSQAAVCDWNVLTGEIYISRILNSWLGFPDAEFDRIIANDPWELLHEDDRARYFEKVQRVQTHQEAEFTDQHRLRCANGSYCTVFMSGRYKYDDNGKVTRFSGLITNQNALAHLEDQLRQAQKLQAVGRLSGGIAHDFNSILAVLIGNLEMIVDGAQSEEVVELAQSSILAVENGADLTTKLMSFARKSPLSRSEITLKSLVEDLATILERSIAKEIQIRYEFVENPEPVSVDVNMAENAILNLILNACDAIPANGHISIVTATEIIPKDYKDTSGEPIDEGTYQTLTIEDNGEGISPENLERVLEPFFTTKPPEQGSGLGLSMVHGFMKQVDGYVEIHSEIGVGTKVKIGFPSQAMH